MSADFLLIDIGNTSVKLRLARAATLVGSTRRLATATLLAPVGASALRTTLGTWSYERVVFSSVVPPAGQIVARLLPGSVRVGTRSNTGVDLRGYPGLATLGADRIANMAGALALYGPGPLIVVDFGTAATFNALDRRGRFLGGAIAPGPGAMRDVLSARAAQLPSVRLEGAMPRAIGRTTRAAMRSGALIGYRGLVREILAALRLELGPARVVATGGDARFLSSRIETFDVVNPDLTLEGLRVIAARAAKGRLN